MQILANDEDCNAQNILSNNLMKNMESSTTRVCCHLANNIQVRREGKEACITNAVQLKRVQVKPYR